MEIKQDQNGFYGGLKRAWYFGVSCSKVRLDTPPNPTYGTGFLIQRIQKNSPADRSALRVNDILIAAGSLHCDHYKTVSQLLKKINSKAVQTEWVRGDQVMKQTVILEEKPLESTPDFHIDYTSFQAGKHKVRTIITTPETTDKTQCFPAILFIQGISCDSIDYPFSDTHPYKKLLYGLTSMGYITIRVERFGTGDSEGPPPEDSTFLEELALFSYILKYISNIKNIRGDRIFLFGYSMGGVIAPILAAKTPEIKGIIVFGTFTSKFSEYCVKNRIRQHRLKGFSTAEIEQDAAGLSALFELLFTQKLTPRQIFNIDPSFQKYFSDDYSLFGRNYVYFQQLEAIPISDYWGKTRVPALIIAGKNDYVIDYTENEKLLNFLTESGHSSVRLLRPNVDHNFFDKSIHDFSSSTVREIGNYLDSII